MVRHISREVIFISFLSFVLTLLSLIQTWMYLYETPSGFVYPLVHNYVPDFYWYLSLMRQGWDGTVLLTSHYTSERFPPQLVNTFFPLLGFLSRLSWVSLPWMYTIFRIIGGTGLLIAGYLMALEMKLTREQRVVAFLCMVLGAPFWFREGESLRQVGEFWTGFDPILRMSWLPHHLFSNIFLILSLIRFSKISVDRTWSYFFKSSLFGVLSIWLNPASALTIAAAVLVGICVEKKKERKQILFTGLYGFVLVIPLVLLYLVQNSVFPWTAFRDWERFVFYPIDIFEFLKVLGIVGIVAIPGIFVAMKTRSMIHGFVVGWFLVPFLGLSFLSTVLPLSNGRYMQNATYIPAAILAALVFGFVSKAIKVPKLFLWGVFLIVMIVFNFPTFSASLERQNMYVDSNRANTMVYLTSATWEAMEWLGMHAGVDAVIVAPPDVSTMLPAFTPMRVLQGHPTFTYMGSEKKLLVDQFYAGSSDTVLDQYGVRYVWIPRQMPLHDFFASAGWNEVHRNDEVSIYERE